MEGYNNGLSLPTADSSRRGWKRRGHAFNEKSKVPANQKLEATSLGARAPVSDKILKKAEWPIVLSFPSASSSTERRCYIRWRLGYSKRDIKAPIIYMFCIRRVSVTERGIIIGIVIVSLFHTTRLTCASHASALFRLGNVLYSVLLCHLVSVLLIFR